MQGVAAIYIHVSPVLPFSYSVLVFRLPCPKKPYENPKKSTKPKKPTNLRGTMSKHYFGEREVQKCTNRAKIAQI